MGFILGLIRDVFDVRLQSQSRIINEFITIGNIICQLLMWSLIIGWILLNKGHRIVCDDFESIIQLNIKESIYTNYSQNDFNTIYVNPSEFNTYNRVWDNIDYVTIYPKEIFVTTNLVITTNQMQSICPDFPFYRGVLCYNDSQCEKGFNRPDGVQTGKCVNADFPYYDSKSEIWSNVTVCEIKGWCPATRTLPPLKNYRAVLGATVNNTVWLKNIITYHYNDLTTNDENDKTLDDLMNCRYNPETDPHCPVFILGDIIKYTPNAGQTYEEMAKWGAVIAIRIEWNCEKPTFSSFDSHSCKPNFSFKRIDVGVRPSITGPLTYRTAHYFNNDKTRTAIRSHGIRFVASVSASLSVFNFYSFITHIAAYSGISVLASILYIRYIRYKYPNLTNDEMLDVNNYTNESISNSRVQDTYIQIEHATNSDHENYDSNPNTLELHDLCNENKPLLKDDSI